MAAAGPPDRKFSEAAFLSEVFHSLSQPLTALHCTLDLALECDRTVEQLRASVQSALDNAERLRQQLLLTRALKDAADPGEIAEPVDICALFRELGDDFSPLFDSTGRELAIDIGVERLRVRADERRLTQALFTFLEYLFRYLPEGATLSVSLDQGAAGRAEIRIDSPSCLPIGPDCVEYGSPCSCETELLRRTFLAVNGEFELTSCDSGRSVWLGTLPLIEERTGFQESSNPAPIAF